MIIWRSHIKIVGSPGRSRIDLCLNKSVLAMGWSLNDRHLEEHNFSEDEKRKICKQRAAIKSYEDYELKPGLIENGFFCYVQIYGCCSSACYHIYVN